MRKVISTTLYNAMARNAAIVIRMGRLACTPPTTPSSAMMGDKRWYLAWD
jgi:hypothetical protein